MTNFPIGLLKRKFAQEIVDSVLPDKLGDIRAEYLALDMGQLCS